MNGQFVSKQARVEYIDLFRAFGIILMIMGHIKFGAAFDKWIHAFHMPMFFFISGWFYRSKEDISVWKQICRKAKSLLVPYIVFEMVQWIILLPFIPEYRNMQTLIYILTQNTYKIPIESGTFGISPIPGAMWFLTAIFLVDAFYILLDRVLRNNWKLHAAIIILAVFGMLAPTILPIRLPWAMDAAFAGIGFFHIAGLIRGTKVERILSLKLWQAVLIGVLFSVSIMVCPKINMRTGNYGWYFPFWFNALGAIIGGWNLALYIEHFFMHCKPLRVVSDYMKGIGRNSIVYLCFNQVVILAVTKALDMIGINGIAAKIPVLILAMVLLFVFEKMICNTKIKMIIAYE